MPRTPHRRLPAISLFSGAGGLDLGFKCAGYEVRAAVEVDPAACATLRRNWPDLRHRLLQQPLEAIPTADLLKVARLRVGEAAIVYGGPPCQSWCVAGNRRGFDDPRGRSLLEFCRVIREARPISFCIENVPGLLTYGGPDVLELIADHVNADPGGSYTISADVLNAAEFGVPQQRRRLFIVGWRTAAEFYFPAATHSLRNRPRRPAKRPAVTVGQAFEGLPLPDPPSALAYRIAATIPQRNRQWYGKQ